MLLKQSKKCKAAARIQLAREKEKKTKFVHSIRAGSLPGEHDVLFAATDEIFTIKHESFLIESLRRSSGLVERSVTRLLQIRRFINGQRV